MLIMLLISVRISVVQLRNLRRGCDVCQADQCTNGEPRHMTQPNRQHHDIHKQGSYLRIAYFDPVTFRSLAVFVEINLIGSRLKINLIDSLLGVNSSLLVLG
jgi:hypothetical protein